MIGIETALQSALLRALRSDPAIQAIFGTPARIFDGQPTSDPAHPFMWIARHRTSDAGADQSQALEHVIDVQILSRRGGTEESLDALDAMREVIETMDPDLSGHRLILIFPVFSDALRLRDGRTVRATFRLRALTQTEA